MLATSSLLALDIGGTHVRVALIGERHLLSSKSVVWPDGLRAAEEVQFIANVALEYVAETQSGPVYAAGVALAALTDQDGTVVQWPNRPHWRGIQFKFLLQQWLNMPVIVEDDANAATMAEWELGAGKHYQQCMVIVAGTGIGSGLILNGELFHGHHGWAGEIGHMVVQPGGPECSCGHSGCLQLFASGRALERMASAHACSCSRELTEVADRGEAWAQKALFDCGYWLGLTAANVVNLLDLEAVIVGGGLSSMPALWWSGLEQSFSAHILDSEQRHVALLRSAFAENASLQGAACLVQRFVHTRLVAEKGE